MVMSARIPYPEGFPRPRRRPSRRCRRYVLCRPVHTACATRVPFPQRSVVRPIPRGRARWSLPAPSAAGPRRGLPRAGLVGGAFSPVGAPLRGSVFKLAEPVAAAWRPSLYLVPSLRGHTFSHASAPRAQPGPRRGPLWVSAQGLQFSPLSCRAGPEEPTAWGAAVHLLPSALRSQGRVWVEAGVFLQQGLQASAFQILS